jgi:choline kinase
LEAVILAAGLSSRLWPLTINKPKCLLEIGGTTLLERQIDQLRRNKIKKIHVVVGHAADAVMTSVPAVGGLSYIYNPDYRQSNSSISLLKALAKVRGPFVLLLSDYYYDEGVLEKIIRSDADFAIAVDRTVRPAGDSVKVLVHNSEVIRIGKDINHFVAGGCFAGAVKAGTAITGRLQRQIEELAARGEKNRYVVDIFDSIIRHQQVEAYAADVGGLFWDEIDTADDLERVRHAVELQARMLSVI